MTTSFSIQYLSTRLSSKKEGKYIEAKSAAQMLITRETTSNLSPSHHPIIFTFFFYSFNIVCSTPHHSGLHPVSRHPHHTEMSSTGNSNPPSFYTPSLSRKMGCGKKEKKSRKKKRIKYFSSLPLLQGCADDPDDLRKDVTKSYAPRPPLRESSFALVSAFGGIDHLMDTYCLPFSLLDDVDFLGELENSKLQLNFLVVAFHFWLYNIFFC
ncbi:uncharacterized protein NPIL_185071 [Nephila pilipes]|uniref:Uncharacterized protein n=1 Tax=Nephila pilipes TaxID=299642 RepID=A0A8X6Q5S3_NEPPI|nr:uncharacterized protein NPIL_185071 [Nephila pilipes]